ncbi:hypothetical protein YC2023_058318 [Brassica napus]
MTHITTKPRSKSVISKLSKLIFCCMPNVQILQFEIRSGERFDPARDSFRREIRRFRRDSTTSAISPARFDYSDDVGVRRDLAKTTSLNE